MKKIIDRRKLSAIIFRRLGSSLSKRAIYDAIGIINESLSDMIVDNKAISVSNFGTLAPYLFHKHNGLNINTCEMQEVKELKTVKFRVHNTFKQLLEQRKHKFEKTQK